MTLRKLSHNSNLKNHHISRLKKQFQTRFPHQNNQNNNPYSPDNPEAPKNPNLPNNQKNQES